MLDARSALRWAVRLVPAALLFVASPALAQQAAPLQSRAGVGARPPRPLRLVAHAGYDYAFEDLLYVEYENGSRSRIGANGGFTMGVGAAFLPLLEGALETRATVGVKYDLVSGTNGRAVFYGFPVELLEAFNVRPVRLSAGLSLLFAPRLRGSGFLADMDLDFRDSLGVVGQAEWVLPFRGGGSGSVSFGLRYVWQKLELSTGGGAAEASALGAILGVTL